MARVVICVGSRRPLVLGGCDSGSRGRLVLVAPAEPESRHLKLCEAVEATLLACGGPSWGRRSLVGRGHGRRCRRPPLGRVTLGRLPDDVLVRAHGAVRYGPRALVGGGWWEGSGRTAEAAAQEAQTRGGMVTLRCAVLRCTAPGGCCWVIPGVHV